MVEDDAGPGGVGGQVDVEAEAEGHEEEAEVDGREVLAGLADEDADGGGGEGERDDEGEEVDAAEDGGGAEHGLEVEGEEVGAGDEGHAVGEADDEGGDVGAPFEEPERHDGVFGEFPFVEDEEGPDDDAEDEEADDGGGGPGEGYAAEFEAEQEHDCAAGDCERAEPVDGFEAGDDWSCRGFNVEEEEEYYECQSIAGYWYFCQYKSVAGCCSEHTVNTERRY